MKWQLKTVVFMGLLVSMSVILTRFFGVMIGNTIRISFGGVPIIIAGILFGPLAGAITGIAADLIGVMVRSMGGYFIGFTISAALVGYIPGLFFLNQKTDEYPLSKIILSVLTVEILVHLIINTIWLIVMYNRGFLVIFPSRLLTRVIIIPFEVIFLTIILRALKIYRSKTG